MADSDDTSIYDYTDEEGDRDESIRSDEKGRTRTIDIRSYGTITFARGDGMR
jgi:hypothetical protein